MHTADSCSKPAHPNYLVLSVLGLPSVAFAIYVAWIVVPGIVSEVVPVVVRAVTNSN